MSKARCYPVRALAELGDDALAARVAEMAAVARGPANGELSQIEAAIRAFEKKRGLHSEEMQRRLAAGTLAEDWDICEWLVMLGIRGRLVSSTPRTSEA